jgi:hypothetical protein
MMKPATNFVGMRGGQFIDPAVDVRAIFGQFVQPQRGRPRFAVGKPSGGATSAASSNTSRARRLTV